MEGKMVCIEKAKTIMQFKYCFKKAKILWFKSAFQNLLNKSATDKNC